jgi:GDPmannose 4,6-dehydratase
MTAVIFGANGQDGYYLRQLLQREGIHVVGVSRNNSDVQGSVADFETVKNIVGQYKPDYVFDFAANSTTRHDVLFENHETICTGTLNILEAVKLYSPATKVFLSGSGLQFRNDGKPIRETDPFEASSPYSVSRIQSVYAARYYHSLGIKVYFGYFFNHDSPIRPERHMSNKIAGAVRRISQGSDERLEIGDFSVKKEWAFAGDIVRGVYTLVQQDTIFEAIIGSGEAYSIEEWLEECFGLIGKSWRDYVIQRAGFTSEYSVLVSNPSLIFSTGWRPEVSFSSLAKMMVLENE